MITAAPLPCLQAFGSIIAGLCDAVAARHRYLPGPLIALIYWRLRRMARRFVALAERVRAGTYRPPLARPERPARERVRAAAPPPEVSMPRSYGSLCALVPLVANYGSQIAHLLKDPEMAALVAATPALQRMLKPVLTILGVGDWPAAIPPPPALLRMHKMLRGDVKPRAAVRRVGPNWRRVDVTGGSDKLSPRWIAILREGVRRWKREDEG